MSFHIHSTKEHLANTGGIALAAKLARISGLTRLRFPVRTWSGALLNMFGLLCMGGSAYEDIAGFRKGELFRSAFGLECVPARETIRIYLGPQHSQKGTPEFLARNLRMIKQLGLSHPVLFRLDSGNDAVDMIKKPVVPDCFFLIKRNLRREPVEQWREIAETHGTAHHPRSGKFVEIVRESGGSAKTGPSAMVKHATGSSASRSEYLGSALAVFLYGFRILKELP